MIFHQANECSNSIHDDVNQNGSFLMLVCKFCRRDLLCTLITVECKSCALVNSTFDCLGITSSSFCASLASRMQQMTPGAIFRSYLYYSAKLRATKVLGSTASFPRPFDDSVHRLSVTVLNDSGSSGTSGQLCYIAWLLIGSLERGSLYHVIS